MKQEKRIKIYDDGKMIFFGVLHRNIKNYFIGEIKFNKLSNNYQFYQQKRVICLDENIMYKIYEILKKLNEELENEPCN